MATRSKKPAAKSTDTEGVPSASVATPSAGPNPSEGAQSSTNVTGVAPEVQTTEVGKDADAGMTAPASATASDTEISGGLPSATAIAPQHAQPEPTSVVEGASSSSAEASIATAQATEAGEAVGQVVTGNLPATDTSNAQDTSLATSDAPQPDAGDLQGIVRITSRIEGFRRAGMRHSKTPADHPFDAFTSEQLDQLDDEPNLKVEYL